MQSRSRTVLALRLASALALTGCAGEEILDSEKASEHEDVGQVGLSLVLPDGSLVEEVAWRLLRQGVEVRAGVAPVQDDGRTSFYVGGVRGGAGYTVELTGARSGGQPACVGKSPVFEVVVGETVMVSITLHCDGLDNTGNVDVDGQANICPTAPAIAAAPTSSKVNGKPVAISATSTDSEGKALSYQWSASGPGRFTDATAASTQFTCTTQGDVTLTVAVRDEEGCSKTNTVDVTCEPRCDVQSSSDFRTQCDTAGDQVLLAKGLSASYATREIANNADQYVFWPHASESPSHIVFCIESSRELLADGRLQPSVQVMNIETKQIHTLVRGMVGCDGIRTTPWGTVLATEEFADDNGGLYEILLDVNDTESYSVSERGANGAPAVVVDSAGNDASNVVIKRTSTPSMAWEGLLVLPSGVIIGGDEERPGSIAVDADGGAIFKFVPSALRTAAGPISSLAESPLVAGTTHALQVSCVNNQQQYGQGCEIGNGAWIQVDAATARPDSNERGGTGYYRPEDLEQDPHFAGPGIRFCFANTGNRGGQNYGEVLCAVDSQPDAASATTRSVVVNRFIEGDTELNQPDNIAFHPTVPGMLYVIEDNGNGDIWACLPDGADRDIKSDGCVRMLSVMDRSAEPTGFIFAPNGTEAYLSVQHSRDGNMPRVDGYATDDLLLISGFQLPDLAAVNGFGLTTQASLASQSQDLFGFGTPLASSSSTQVARASTFPGGVAPSVENNGFGTDASATVSLADGLSATFLTRIVASNADQFQFWPHGSQDPDYLLFCIEGRRELVSADKYNPSVQSIDIRTGAVKTIVRGMVGCDGLRVSPWGTILATEEFADDNGALYEILWDPTSDVEYSIVERGVNGAPALIVDRAGNDATSVVVKRTALPSMAWEGLLVLDSGVVIGGDEERPGSVSADSDGGAIFKFVPSVLRTGSSVITNLSESPLVAGSNYAMQVSCVNNQQQFGQGCEIGNAAWVPVAAATARLDADIVGATGYYRPEDLEMDPDYTGEGVRFCFANTGNAGAANYGEVLCAVDRLPNAASATSRTVVVNRFVEGDTQLNAPDNIEFQAGSGILYVIEDAGFGDVWACLPDSGDRDIKSDGCVRALSLKDRTAEPTGFKFHPNGRVAYVSVQHSQDPANAQVDNYNTDDVVIVSGFEAVSAARALSFGPSAEERLASESTALFGFGRPLALSAGR